MKLKIKCMVLIFVGFIFALESNFAAEAANGQAFYNSQVNYKELVGDIFSTRPEIWSNIGGRGERPRYLSPIERYEFGPGADQSNRTAFTHYQLMLAEIARDLPKETVKFWQTPKFKYVIVGGFIFGVALTGAYFVLPMLLPAALPPGTSTALTLYQEPLVYQNNQAILDALNFLTNGNAFNFLLQFIKKFSEDPSTALTLYQAPLEQATALGNQILNQSLNGEVCTLTNHYPSISQSLLNLAGSFVKYLF